MNTALKLDIEKANYELRCLVIRTEEFEDSIKFTQKHINKYGMSPDAELGLARLELQLERHELDKKEKRMELMCLYKKSLNNVKQG